MTEDSSSSSETASPEPQKSGTRRSSPRSKARRSAMQALYQWQVTQQPVAEILAQFRIDEHSRAMDEPYFTVLCLGVTEHATQLDEALTPILDRPVAQLDLVERAILRLGAFELIRRVEVPWRVAINEAVELARTFGAEQSHRYINGILDALAHKHRPDWELERHAGGSQSQQVSGKG